MNGITYFKLNSPYEGDVTKNCGLTGIEVDNNFFTLEGRDIKSVTLDGDSIYINLMNGDRFSVDCGFSNYTKDLEVEYDKENGILYVTRNGETKEISGFLTHCEEPGETINNYIQSATDTTLVGSGTVYSPLGVAPSLLTGHYKSVITFVDTANGEQLPSGDSLTKGDRYLTTHRVSAYGLFYDFNAVRQIACDLTDSSSEWRVPTKEDWDDMLNAIEPDEDYRDHADTCNNQYLGKFAGKFLKSEDYWQEYAPSGGNDSTADNTCSCGQNISACNPTYCGNYSSCRMKPSSTTPAGIDKYGFNALPAGYGDDGGRLLYLGERAAFWTASAYENCSSAFMKRLSYDRSDVYQDMIPCSYLLSVRLVKDYNGYNFYTRDNILGEWYDTVLMPSLSSGHKVWTSVNIALTDQRYRPVEPNNGQDLISDEGYYIQEWDGQRWISSPFVEGDMVTILNPFTEDGKYSSEYKIVNGELVCVRDLIAGDVIEVINADLTELEQKIQHETTRATERENQIENDLNARIDGLVADGESTSEQITNIIEQLNDLNDGLQREIVRSTAEDDEHDQKIAEIEDNLIDNVTYDGQGLMEFTRKNGEKISLELTFNFGDVRDLPSGH